MQAANVGMAERRDGLRFALKTIIELAQGRFNRDGPAQSRVGAEIDLAHAAFADHRDDLVVTKLFTGGRA